MKKKHKNIGGSFDDFLEDEGILNEAETTAWKRVIAFQIQQEMKRQNITRTAMAERMKTSRASVSRLLNPDNNAVTLKTLGLAASVLNKKLKVELV